MLTHEQILAEHSEHKESLESANNTHDTIRAAYKDVVGTEINDRLLRDLTDTLYVSAFTISSISLNKTDSEIYATVEKQYPVAVNRIIANKESTFAPFNK